MKKARILFNKKLRNRMLIRVLLTAAAVLFALTFVTFYFTRSLLVSELEAKSRNKVGLAATSIDAWLHDKSQMITILAARAAMGLLPHEARKEFYRRICKQFGGNESLYMAFEKDGEFFTGSDWTPPEGYDPRKRPWYKDAKNSKKAVFSTPYLDPYTKRVVVTVASAVRRENTLVGVLAMDVFIDDVLDKVKSLKIGNSSYAYLVDGSGLFVSHPDKDKVLKNRIQKSDDASYFHRFKKTLKTKAKTPLFENAEIYKGKDYVTIAAVQEAGWFIVFHLSKSEVYKPLGRLLSIFGGGILASLLLMALTISYISHRIAHPILDLAEGARFIAEGDYERRLQIQSRDEIGYLTKSFNDMAEGLKDRDFIKSTFGRYVSKDVMHDILNGNIALGGEKKLITILFSDIRSFTSLSEAMDPEKVVKLLNDYFDEMDTVISAHGGSINKYMGDGILAIYGAPNKMENSALKAVESAREMLAALEKLNKRKSLKLKIGLGIHTGEAVVGNIGSQNRTEYTVIGDAVNLASRIESLTKKYKQDLLISDDTAENVGTEFILRLIDKVRVKGKNIPVTLYSPHRQEEISAEFEQFVKRGNKIMELYFEGDFGAALREIQQMESDGVKPDQHIALIRERCRVYAESEPEAWDGAFTHDSK